MSRDGNFVKLFKKSFASYVESGMKKKTEAEIDILRNELEGRLGHWTWMTEDSKAKFYKIIIENFLRMFHFKLHFKLTHDLTTLFA